MIERVSITNFNNSHLNKKQSKNVAKPSFCGLTDRMGKKVYNGFYDMAILFPKEIMNNPISGKLPDFMEKKIAQKTSDIKGGIKEVLDTFGEVSNELRDFEPNSMSTMKELQNRRNESTVKKLENVLTKYNIIKPWDEFDIKYIDKGGKGSVYKLDGIRHVNGMTDDEFVIKVFHTKSIQSNTYHGCFPEINTASYWMKTLGYDTNRGKFFWGDVKEAYMINKYIDEDVRLPKKFPNPYDNGMKFTDEDTEHIHNVCKQYSYDWGGGVVINQVVNSNSFARSVMNDIKNYPDNMKILQWHKQFRHKPKGNHDNNYAGLSLAIKYLKPENRLDCFEKCFSNRGKYNDRAMGYTLKYLPAESGLYYYEKLASSTKDNVLKQILVNEIPLLATKNEKKHLVHDDLIVMNSVSKEYQDEFIDLNLFNKYTAISKKYNLDKTIIK